MGSPGLDETVPEQALGLVAHAAGDVRVELVPVPRPAADEVVLRVAYGGICGSDLHYWQHGAAGVSILREPMLLGHEMSGTVLRAAADGSGLPAGTLVTLHPGTPHPGDGSVRYPVDRPNLSPAGTYLGSAALLPHTQGVFAQYVVVPSRMLRRLPAAVPLRTAVLVEPASVAWHAVSRAGNVTGKRALVVGAGPIGALVVAALRHRGAAEVVAVDLHPEPLLRAAELGATSTILAADTAAVQRLDVDVAFESSGAPAGLRAAVEATTRGGRVVMIGLPSPGEHPVAVSAAIARELELVGSFRFNDEIDAVLAALGSQTLPIEPVITHEFPVADALAALQIARDPTRSGKVLLTF
jgi:L-idonate 5-dehydrogenase